MKIGIYPGSFDPITNGHLDIIKRASQICEQLYVSVLVNPNKKFLFTLEERVALIEKVVAPFENVKVDYFSGLLVDYARQKGAAAFVKGLRSFKDFEYESQMAVMNRKLAPELETVFLIASDNHTYLSSSLVKEVASVGGTIEGLVPEVVRQAVLEKL